MNGVAERLANVANRSTLRLTHYGRRSGKPYDVTIWFLVEGACVYLVTANRKRQWVRNLQSNPTAVLSVGDERFAGRAEPVTAPAVVDHVVDLMSAKYWYTRPYVSLARLLGWTVSSATFRVSIDAHSAGG
jgi:deazaflavin-dependent oxidoreductase (nitroreductase family)